MPGADIQAFWDPVTTRSRPQSSIANGTAPSAEIASTRISASGAASRAAAASAAMSLVTPVDVSLCVRSTARRPGIAGRGSTDVGGLRGLAPLDLEAGDRGAVDLGDLGEPVAERADRDGQDGVARRERVDHGRLEAAGARAGQHDHVGRGAEVGLHALAHAQQERLELLAPVIDHLAPAGLAHGRVAGRSGRGCAGWVRIGSRGHAPGRGGAPADGGRGDGSPSTGYI